MRNSIQRDTVFKVVKESCDHPSAETIYARTKALLPNISLGTVYRDLAQLVELGEIRQITIASGGNRYDKTVRTHAHLHCKQCGAVVDIGDQVINGLDTVVAEITGTIIDYTDILFIGKCEKCVKEKNL